MSTYGNNQKDWTYCCPNKSNHSFRYLRPCYTIQALMLHKVVVKVCSKWFWPSKKVQLPNDCGDALVMEWSGALVAWLVESELGLSRDSVHTLTVVGNMKLYLLVCTWTEFLIASGEPRTTKAEKTIALHRSLASLRNRGIRTRGCNNWDLVTNDLRTTHITYQTNHLDHVLVIFHKSLVNV